jgi:hypothetical protein
MRWKPAANREEEKQFAKRLRRSSKFYEFLWSIREELFDDRFQDELIAAYSPRGQEPCPPALLAMVMLLQRFDGLSDADAVDEAENDQRWQLVLGTLGEGRAPFGQGSLVRFRIKAIEHDLDKKLVDRTVELAKKTKAYSWKHLKVALDSSPLEGAGRVEDTWNLIGRAMSKVVGAVAKACGVEASVVIEGAGLTVLEGPSVKAALDIDWGDADERQSALERLVTEAEQLEGWVVEQMKEEATKPPVSESLDLLRRIVSQDLEPDPQGGGRRIREGVAEDRVISISDTEMRHGRKSRSTTIKGYKRHIVIANRFILGTTVAPANRPEHEQMRRLIDTARGKGDIASVHFDRGYLASAEIEALRSQGIALHSRPWATKRNGLFGKDQFLISLSAGVVACPAGQVTDITESGAAVFPEATCGACSLKSSCTRGKRKMLKLHRNEDLLIELRAAQASTEGRAEYRNRTDVEHRLARVKAIHGPKARYKGIRKNELDLNRSAAVINLQEIARVRRTAQF